MQGVEWYCLKVRYKVFAVPKNKKPPRNFAVTSLHKIYTAIIALKMYIYKAFLGLKI